MLYAALGDSITYGYSSTEESERFVTKVQKSLSKQPVHLYLNAKPGWTSAQLLKSLPKVPECIWDEARVVTILIGGNDLLHAAPWLFDGRTNRVLKVADRLHQNLTQIVQAVRRSQSTVIVGTLYNPFPHSLMAEEFTDVMNKSIRLVVQREKLVLADIRKQFHQREDKFIEGYRRGTLRDFRIFGNPIHPNDEGHQAIAHTVLSAYRKSLVVGRAARQKLR